MIELNRKILCEHCFEEVGRTGGICQNCGTDPQSNKKRYPGSLSEGVILGTRYVVGKVLGKGGFGITYLCYDLKTGTRVTVKEFFPATLCHRDSGSSELRTVKEKDIFIKGMKRFYGEAKLVAKFSNNPYIVKVTEFFYQNNTAYFVMEYLQGCDLTHYLESHKLDEATALRITRCVLCGLDAMHKKNVLHRDVSPNNIFICSDGSVKLIDFGAARVRIAGESNSLSVILNPGFAPLEQYRSNGNQGPWTDIFAMGVSLYYILKRKVMPSATERLSNNSVDYSGISAYIAQLIKNMTALRIEQRYQTAVAAISDIDTILKAMGQTSELNLPGTANEKQSVEKITGNTGNGKNGERTNTGGIPTSTSEKTQEQLEKEKIIRIVCVICSVIIAIAVHTVIFLLMS